MPQAGCSPCELNTFIKMNKRSSKKTNEQVGKVEEIVKTAREIRDKGEMMGDSMIGMMAQTSCDFVGVATCAIGLAKASAAWKSLCAKLNQDMSSLYEAEFNRYLELYNDVLAEVEDE